MDESIWLVTLAPPLCATKRLAAAAIAAEYGGGGYAGEELSFVGKVRGDVRAEDEEPHEEGARLPPFT